MRYVEGGPTHPDKAAATIEVHPEFDLSLVAAEPLIQKAMNLDWDERGRLWVSETPEYPNGRRVLTAASWKDSGSLAPAGTTRDPEDTISILSDTNGDGRMDRKHVFADKLELVTGFVLHRSGVIAATAPDIWYLEDTNGDEVADKRTKLYTGLGIADTHAVINNLRWGLDGWIYATHGYSTGAAVTSPDGTKNFGRDGSGVVRFRPDGSAFEQYSSRGGNTWGLDVTWDGQVFWTQPTSGTVLFHTVLPESVLAKGRVPNTTSAKGMISGQRTYPLMTWPEQAYVQIDQVGQFTAAAGCAIYDGGAWPERWKGAYFTGEPTLNIVHQQFLRPDGVSYTTVKEAGPRADGVHAQPRSLVPADRDARRSGRRALRHRLLQSGRHSQRHAWAGARSGERRRAARSRSLLRPHLARAAQAGSATRRAGPRSSRPRQSHPCDGDEPERARQADRVAPGAGKLRVGSAPGPGPAGRWAARSLALYERSRAATTNAERAAVLDRFAAATDNWTRSALIGGRHGAGRGLRVAGLQAFASGGARRFRRRRAAGRACPPVPSRSLVAAATHGPATAPLKVIVLRAIGQLDAPAPAADRGLDQSAADAARRSGHDRGGCCRWQRSGTRPARSARRRTLEVARFFASSGPAEPSSDDRRVELAASLLAVPARRAEALAAVAPMLTDPALAQPLRERLIATVGDAAGKDTDAVLIAALGEPASTPVVESVAAAARVGARARRGAEERRRHAGRSRARERRAPAESPEQAGGDRSHGISGLGRLGRASPQRRHRRAPARRGEAGRRDAGAARCS